MYIYFKVYPPRYNNNNSLLSFPIFICVNVVLSIAYKHNNDFIMRILQIYNNNTRHGNI